MNALDTARSNEDKARSEFSKALLSIRNLVPKVPRVCPQTGTRHENECDEWHEAYYGGLTEKKWNALVKAAPQAASQIANIAAAYLAARKDTAEARNAEKAEKAARKAARDEKATYKAQHGARPVEAPNSNAAANYDTLQASLGHLRAAFVTHSLEAATEAALRHGRTVKADDVRRAAGAEFDGYVAKLATKITARVASVVKLVGPLWGHSTLVVETSEGQQAWYTQCIWNYRYSGRNGSPTAYNQWPTRRVR